MITPVYQIIRDGGDLTATIADKFISLAITDKIGPSADTLDLSLAFDGSYAIPRAGVVLEAKIGYVEEGLWDAGRYVVEETDLSGGANAAYQLNIRALSSPVSPQASVSALQGTTERIWQSHAIDMTTFGDIVNEVCRAAGLTAKIDPSLASIPMPTTLQKAESDLAFLLRITILRDAVVKYHDKQVIIEKRDSGNIGELDIDISDVTSFNFNFSDRTKVSSVVARYQDTTAGEVEKYTAGSGEPVFEINDTYGDRQTAVDAAESLLKKLIRDTVTAQITMPTVAGLLAEKVLNLTGFPDASVNAEYIVESVTHKLSSAGLTSSIRAKRRG